MAVVGGDTNHRIGALAQVVMAPIGLRTRITVATDDTFTGMNCGVQIDRNPAITERSHGKVEFSVLVPISDDRETRVRTRRNVISFGKVP
jgi:hypothetical protein